MRRVNLLPRAMGGPLGAMGGAGGAHPVMAGEGRPSTPSFTVCGSASRGWPAFAGHDGNGTASAGYDGLGTAFAGLGTASAGLGTAFAGLGTASASLGTASAGHDGRPPA